MQRRRERLEIVLEILELLNAAGFLRKTRLLQLSGLNMRTFSSVMRRLEELRIVRFEEALNGYTLTRKGLDVLYVLRSLRDIGLLGASNTTPLKPLLTPLHGIRVEEAEERLGGYELTQCRGATVIIAGEDPLLALITAGVDIARGLSVALVAPHIGTRLRIVEEPGEYCRAGG